LIINEKLSLKNYIHDAIDFHAIRQLLVKSRHKILMPILAIALTKNKLKKSAKEYKTSFARNIHERTDRPVFTIDDAVAQLKAVDDTRSEVEKAMDDFFLSHLPADVMQQTDKRQGFELDEFNIRNEKLMAMNTRKCESLKELPRKTDSRKVAPVLNPKFKPKSDLTLGFVNSSNYVETLALRSERHRNIGRMRNNAVTNQTTNP
jgi:hypothetical protein